MLNCELMLRAIQELEDITTSTQFNLNAAPLKFEKFQKCLGGAARDEWDLARHGEPITDEGFKASQTELIEALLDEEDLEIQKDCNGQDWVQHWVY